MHKDEVQRVIGESVYLGSRVLCFASFLPSCSESSGADVINYRPFLNPSAEEALSNVTACERDYILRQWYGMYWSGALCYVNAPLVPHESDPYIHFISDDTVEFKSYKQSRRAVKVAGKAALRATSEASALSQSAVRERDSSVSSNVAPVRRRDATSTLANNPGSSSQTSLRAYDPSIHYRPAHLGGSAAAEEFYVAERDEDATSATVTMGHVSFERTGELIGETVSAYLATITAIFKLLFLFLDSASYLDHSHNPE